MNLIGKAKQGIADVQCRRLEFQPGDRVIVRTHCKVDDDWKRKMRRSLKKFAGCELRVFFIPILEFDLEFPDAK